MAGKVVKVNIVAAAYQSIGSMLDDPQAIMDAYNGVAEFTGGCKIDMDEALDKMRLMRLAVERINGRAHDDL